jgi:catechol 2,3-dioxygenase-like lactoylglutathione lyase family enzyme
MSKREKTWTGISHINFACADMDKTIAFWENIGFEVKFRLTLHDPERYHFFIDVGGNALISYWYWPGRELIPCRVHNDFNFAGYYHLAFNVESEDDLDEMHDRLRAAGVNVSAVHGRHIFDKSIYFTDPDGIQFEFSCFVMDIEGEIEHDGNGTLIPRSNNAKLGKRRLDGPVHFDTKYK